MSTSHAAHKQPYAPPTVLLVDDSIFMRSLLRSILEMGGYRIVAEAGDGKEAVAGYLEHRPTVTVMDTVMPGQSGLEAARVIRDHDPNARIVLCSVLAEFCLAADERRNLNGVLTKPYTPEQVLETMKRATMVEM